MECSKLGGQWKEKEKFPMLGGQWKEKEKLPFHLFPLPPQTTYLNIRPFLLTSQFCFTIVLGCYLHIPFFCLWPINYNAPFNVTSPPHIRCRFGLVEDPIFFFTWNYCITHGHDLRASNSTSEWKAGPKIIFRFDVDTTSSWWKPRTTTSARPSWSRPPSSLVISHFSKLSHLSDHVQNLVTNRLGTKSVQHKVVVVDVGTNNLISKKANGQVINTQDFSKTEIGYTQPLHTLNMFITQQVDI